MKLLISNDDGVFAPGIQILAEELQRSEYDLKVVAPDRNKSGMSSALSLDKPLRAVTLSNGFVSVNGSPADCVHLALTGLITEEPDLVISGINAGANLGDDVWYSGTVAAAMEGRFLGKPSIAVSLVGNTEKGELQHYATAARVVSQLIVRLPELQLSPRTVLNVNVPDLPLAELRGLQVTRLGHRNKPRAVVRMVDPRGQVGYWLGGAGDEGDAGEGTDFYAVRAGYVSVTPLHVDMTRYQSMDDLAKWLAMHG